MEKIRMATSEDAKELVSIYAFYVRETPISFETEIPKVDDFRQRISKVLEKFPWLVYEEGGKILGYAYADQFKTRAAYAWSIESSVYLRNDCRGRGIGKKLYAKLFDQLKTQGALNIIGGVTLPNEASVRLHESFGFKPVARFKDVGFKFGKWWDVGYWQLELRKSSEPVEVKSAQQVIHQLDKPGP